jgi:hypothetical protein
MLSDRGPESKARQFGRVVPISGRDRAYNSPAMCGFCEGDCKMQSITVRDGSPGLSLSKVGPRGIPVRRDLNVLALLKGGERYVYLYDDESRGRLIDVFRDDAANPRLSLSWFDVAVLTEKAGEQTKTAADEPPAESRI